MTLEERLQLQLRLKRLQEQLQQEQDMFRKFEIGDEILELKNRLGQWQPPEPGEDCIGCGS